MSDTAAAPAAAPTAPAPATYQLLSWGITEDRFRVVLKIPNGKVVMGTVGQWTEVPTNPVPGATP